MECGGKLLDLVAKPCDAHESERVGLAPFDDVSRTAAPGRKRRTDNEPHHGVLLRRDLHIALDINWLSIDQEGRVEVSEFLGSSSPEYLALHGRSVQIGATTPDT